jgi:hypothetical protein
VNQVNPLTYLTCVLSHVRVLRVTLRKNFLFAGSERAGRDRQSSQAREIHAVEQESEFLLGDLERRGIPRGPRLELRQTALPQAEKPQGQTLPACIAGLRRPPLDRE